MTTISVSHKANKLKNSYFSYFLMINFYYLSWALSQAIISVYLLNKGMTASQVSMIVSGSFVVSMLAQPYIGVLSDRYGAMKVNIALFLILPALAVWFLLSHSFMMMLISYSFLMALINGANPTMEKIASASPYPYGKVRVWGTIGYAAGSQISGLIYDNISPEAIWICFIISILLTAAGTCLTEPETEAHPAGKTEKTAGKDLFKNRKFLYYLLIAAIFYGASSMANTFVPAMFTAKGMDVSLASTILSIAVLFEIPFVFFSGRFMDRISNKALLIIAYGMVTVQFAVYAFDLPLPLTVIATMLAKHPAGMLFIMINLKVVHTLIDQRQIITALALVATVKNLASIISQNIAGVLLETYSYSTLFMIFLMILLAGFAFTAVYRIHKGTDLNLFS